MRAFPLAADDLSPEQKAAAAAAALRRLRALACMPPPALSAINLAALLGAAARVMHHPSMHEFRGQELGQRALAADLLPQLLARLERTAAAAAAAAAGSGPSGARMVRRGGWESRVSFEGAGAAEAAVEWDARAGMSPRVAAVALLAMAQLEVPLKQRELDAFAGAFPLEGPLAVDSQSAAVAINAFSRAGGAPLERQARVCAVRAACACARPRPKELRWAGQRDFLCTYT
jgi:hypothetical protein